jgi:hypothetical protein
MQVPLKKAAGNPWRIWIFGAGIACAMAFCIWLAFGLILTFSDRWYWLPAIPFERARWLQLSQTTSTEKESMAKYLIQTKNLVGHAKSEVYAQLGSPDFIGYSSPLNPDGTMNQQPRIEDTLHYKLGAIGRMLAVELRDNKVLLLHAELNGP